MRRAITKLFGNRVALQLVEEEYKGLVVLPSTAERVYVLSKVIAIGDQVTANIKVNDIVFWQTNGMIQKMNRHDLNGIATFIMLTGDMIARLTSQVVKLENFQVVGDWCLVKREVVQPSKIIIPDEVAEANQETTVRWLLEQKGEQVGDHIEVGNEVAVERSRACPIKLEDSTYYYIHKNSILGVIG